MARSIKHYNGFYDAQATTFMDVASTGYTVPTGKVARIGFSFSCYGGSYQYFSMAGFYAGGATAASTNRFLLMYMPSATTANETNQNAHCTYWAGKGHIFSRISDENQDPKLFIQNGVHCERETTRESNDWINNNFASWSGSNYALLQHTFSSTSTTTSQRHELAPHVQMSSASSYVAETQGLAGEVHAFAGETIYLFDYAGSNGQTSLNYRPWRQCAWDMFIIEEDAG